MSEPKKSRRRSNVVTQRRPILPGNTDDEEEAPIKRRPRPGTTVEERENQLIAMTVALAARQIEAGTASSQVMTHFLKLGSTREKLEQLKLRQENNLLEAKTESIHSSKDMKKLVSNALVAMQRYTGNGATMIEVDDDDDED